MLLQGKHDSIPEKNSPKAFPMSLNTNKFIRIAEFLHQNNSNSLLLDMMNLAKIYFPSNESIALLRAKVLLANRQKKSAVESLITWQRKNYLSSKAMNLIVMIENEPHSAEIKKYAFWSVIVDPSKEFGISQLLGFSYSKNELQKEIKILYWLSTFFEPNDSRFVVLLRKEFERDRDAFFDLLNSLIEKHPSQPWLRYFRALLGVVLENQQEIEQDVQFLKKDRKNDFLARSIDCIKGLGKSKVDIFYNRLDLFKFALNISEINNYFSDDLILEFGVYKGKSTRMISSLINRKLHAFDSFFGLPEDWENEPAGSYSNEGEIPQLPKNVIVHKGLFSDTLPIFKEKYNQKVRFLHIDCDLYTSTSDIFKYMGSRFQQGTVIVFDEYFGYPGFENHECRAFEEFLQLSDRKTKILAIGPFTNQLAIQLL